MLHMMLVRVIKEMQKKQQYNLQAFLLKYRDSLSQEVKEKKETQIKANILSVEDVEEAATKLKNGELVAFPTETVYGLGANALNADALSKIYQTKKRPLTDPIIVHVLDGSEANQLVQMSEKQRVIFQLLTKQFWPGPLTIILKANLDLLPLMVTAQTGYVGIRAPRNEVARKIIEKSGVPIGAPSANLFSHVSPTESVHVFNDFYDCDISIIDGERCNYGVESTVIKLLQKEIHVLREGSLSISKLQSFLKVNLSEQELPSVVIHRKVVLKTVNMEAPGQALKHYAPYLPCYYFSGAKTGDSFYSISSKTTQNMNEAAFISFNKDKFSTFREHCKYYFEVGYNTEDVESEESEEELFCSKEEKMKMREIYALLRKCQNLPVKSIVVGWFGPHEGTLWDKIFRSTQGEEVECV